MLKHDAGRKCVCCAPYVELCFFLGECGTTLPHEGLIVLEMLHLRRFFFLFNSQLGLAL